MYKIGIIARPFGIYSDSLKKLNNFFKIKLYKKKERPNKRDLIKFAIDCDGLIAGGEVYDREILSSLPKLKIISRVGIGVDNIDIKYAKSKKISVFNTPDAPSNSTAEFAFSLILSSVKKIYILGQNVKNKNWTRIHHYEFSNLNVGLIGCGRIGSRVLKLLIKMPFKKIFVNDIDKKKYKIKSKKIVYTSKSNIFKKADIISFHVPLTPQTRNLFNKKNITLTKKGVAVVNTARGEIININHLEDFIKKNHFSTVALDVMPMEPYFGPLLKYKNCIITPHNASMSFTSRKNMELGSAKNLMNFFKLT
jgi:D-3-phosphoglycerate dehydrogenase